MNLVQQQNSGSANTPASSAIDPATGTAGLGSQVGGQPVTVSGVQDATGGMGGLIQPDVDQDIFLFERNQNSLMQLMLNPGTKKVNATSMEVKHYAIDQGTPLVTVAGVSGNTITLVNADKGKVRASDTLMVKDVYGYEYTTTGNVQTSMPLQLVVKSVNNDDTITCIATNGVKQAATDEYGSLPTSSSPTSSNTNVITAGTKLVRMANAMYETQKWVDPNLIVPVPELLFLQKRGMTSVVSDYFESQRKEVPFSQALIAEAQLREFKSAGNRTLLISQPSKYRVRGRSGDSQWAYTTTGVRWQVKREFKHTGAWSVDEVFALIKFFYSGADKPKSGIWLVGENLALALQLLNWHKHPEMKIDTDYKNETLGWKVTRISCIFGDIQIKMEPVMDDCGFSNSGIILGEDRLVHYVRKPETPFSEDVEGEEAKRTGVNVSDALGLKGSCHVWVDGDSDNNTAPNASLFHVWQSDTAPTASDLEDGHTYIFVHAMTVTIASKTVDIEIGEAYTYTTSDGLKKYYGVVSAA